MFALRFIAVSLSTFILCYCVLSILVTGSWRLIARWSGRLAPSRAADVLFALRMFPLAASVLITLLYAAPSFLILEPAEVEESLGSGLVVLGCGCLAWLVLTFARSFRAQQRAARLLFDWTQQAKPIEQNCVVSVLQVSSEAPVLAVAGLFTPSVLISKSTSAMLSQPELQIALKHEVAHVRRWDNLKKLLFLCGTFPAMGPLESAWSELSEMAADDAAVTNSSEALDLASALIKVSRFASVQPVSPLTTSLLAPSAGLLSARVERLSHWESLQSSQRHRPSRLPVEMSLVAACICVVLTYGPLLTSVHALTEWLVRASHLG